MGKIICEVCGTVYPDSADSCPICGYSRDMGDFGQGGDLLREENDGAAQSAQSDFDQSFYDDLGIDLSEFQDTPVSEQPYQEPQYQAPQYQQPQYRQPQSRQTGEAQNGHKRPIFDYDAVNPQERRPYNTYDSYQDVGNEVTLNDYPEDSYDNYDNYGQPPKSHTGLIVFLIILILLLIGASAFLLFKFVLPNLTPQAPTVPETIVTEAPTTMPTTEPTIPCTGLALVDGGNVVLTKEGQFFLIHASVSPEDTTDTLTYVSQDENIVQVDEGGKITAVGEGETFVVLTCGSQTISMPVKVSYQAETQPAETAPQAAAEAPEGAEATAAPAATEAAATEAPAQAAETEATGETLKNVELKLKKTDLMSGVKGVSFRLELDCDLDPTEVTWSSTDTGVAQVKDGVVTTIGSGTCKIVAKYGSQEASCVIRCTF